MRKSPRFEGNPAPSRPTKLTDPATHPAHQLTPPQVNPRPHPKPASTRPPKPGCSRPPKASPPARHSGRACGPILLPRAAQTPRPTPERLFGARSGGDAYGLLTAQIGGSVRVEAQEGRNEGWSTADGRRARRLSRPAPATSTPTCVVDREGLRMAGHRMAGQAGQRQRGPMPPCGGAADTRRAAQAVRPAAGLDKCVTIWLHVTRWNQISRSSDGD